MRNITLSIFLLFLNIMVFAQPKVELTIQNMEVINDEAFFDIYLRQSGDAGEVVNLAFADFIIEYDPTVFISPTLEKIDNPSPPLMLQNGYCTFSPTVTDETQKWISQSYYHGGIDTDVLNNNAVINLFPPFPYDDTDFDEKIAIIDGQATQHRLGRFKLTGYSSGAIDLNWVTNSNGLQTKIYAFDDVYPYNSNNVIVTENLDPPNFIPTVPIFIQDEVQQKMTILPNPIKEMANLSLPIALNKDAQIIVYNLIGKQVNSATLLAGQATQQIDFSGLPAGYYLVQLKGDNWQQTKKILKSE